MRARQATLLLTAALIGCAPAGRDDGVARSAGSRDTSPAVAVTHTPLRGAWKSEGYGLVVVGDGDSLRTYEVTATTCVPATVLARRSETPEGAESAYASDGDVVFVTPEPSDSVKRLHNDGAASDIILRRIDALPATCATPTADTPLDNFEVFTRTWSEHYILFDEKKVDWGAITAAARARVTTRTTPAELFDILSSMIAPFHDAHTFIEAPTIGKAFRTLREGTDRAARAGIRHFVEKDLPELFALTDRQLQRAPRHFCNDQLQFGTLDDSTGYLRIVSEGGYTKGGGFAGGLVALEAALDTIFLQPSLRGLVIDVRVNFGGADPYGLALASRLATESWVAYSKEARLDPTDRTRWTPGQPSIVRPSTRPGFKGPVVELTGPLTISAGETTTQALMGRRPHVLRIGEHTQGVFSDVLARRLPNGWRFGLPNEVFRTAGGKTYDGPGIPPDFEVPVYADADRDAGRDLPLERARAELYRPR